MNVLIDADGCPVMDITVSLCVKYGVSCLLLCDTAHEFQRPGAKTLTFDKSADSVDFALVNRVRPGDIVITQDYGLASMCLAIKARVLHQDGWEYTPENIDALLLVRHESRKRREAGVRFRGPKKRTHEQDQHFYTALDRMLHIAIHG